MPLSSIADTNSSFKQPLIQLSRFSTPHRLRKHERKAFSASDFDDVLRSVAQSQYEYIGWPRKTSVRVCGPWFRALAPCDSHLLCAANVEARIRFAKIAVHEVLRHLEDHSELVCFFSICPVRYVAPLHRAHSVDLTSLKKLTGQAFRGCSLVGSTDFALFKGFGQHGVRACHNHVGAHTHGLVWGKSQSELQELLAAMGPEFINVKGQCAGYVREISADELAGYMRYSLKLPLFEYNVKADQRETLDPQTGEIFHGTKVSPNPLRPGDQLRMSALLRDMYLDDLIFGQGEGTSVVREIRHRARAPLVHLNRLAETRTRHTPIAIGASISHWERTPVSKLLRNPPRKVWLGRRPPASKLKSFLSRHNTSNTTAAKLSSLPDLVFN